ncbi:hypothetical protein [Nannocystis pusilla]|uniref:Uncharacterized protein n=1 Tax=Nannocystis pusilla TaxID=889268 RepID=A0ABS7U187_9BACT|nr:hypothetical protein [Nannocystis pusilla]MBZ5714293.1 hypothetical protein [Nannocystis pusilla]
MSSRIDAALVLARRALSKVAALVAAAFAVRVLAVEPTYAVASALAYLILLVALGGWLVALLDLIGGIVWPVLRRTVIAAGLVRASYWLSLLARASWERDREGGKLVAAALALLHRPHDAALATWLEGKIHANAKTGLGGIVATGLLAASRGDSDGARDILAGADAFDPDFAPAAARRAANDWLVADAASRGDWITVIRRGVLPGQATAYTRFLARAAARIRGEALPGEPNPTDFGLWISWLLAPGRKVMRPLLVEARAAPRVLHQRKPPPPQPAMTVPLVDPAAHADDPVAHAQALHATWLALRPKTPGQAGTELEQRLSATRMQELCRAWEEAWPHAERRMRQRVAVLTTQTRAEEALAGIRRAVARELAELARAARLPLATFEVEVLPTAALAAEELRAELLTGVETGSEELRARTAADRRLPPAEESRAWNQFRRRYEEAVLLGGMPLRYLLFPQVHRDVCGYAVWLWNDRKEYGLSGPMFRWLLAEAEAVGDVEAIELQRKNVGAKR